MFWITGLVGSLLGVALGSLVTLWAATRFNSLPTFLLTTAAILPLFGFLAGAIPVAKRREQWPGEGGTPALLVGMATGLSCALGAYLSFVMVSYTWNKDTLPPGRRSMVELIAHPEDVP